MNAFHNNHEQGQEAKKLSALLSSVTVPEKKQLEWQKLENDLFCKMDELQKTKLKPWSNLFFIPKFAIPYVALTAVILFAGGLGIHVVLNNASNYKSTASLASVQGKVVVLFKDKTIADTISAVTGLLSQKPLLPGTVIMPLAGSSAILLLDNGSIIKLYPNSSATIKAATMRDQICYLTTGSLLAKVSKRNKNQRFEIQSASATCSVVGTVFRVDAKGRLQTTLSVYQGKVKMIPASGSADQTTLVGTGSYVTMAHNGKQVSHGEIAETDDLIKDISILSMIVEHPSMKESVQSVLDVSSEPSGAKVLIDNKMVGVTPLLFIKPMGVYTISILADGYSPWEQKMTSDNNRLNTITATLTQNTVLRPGVISKKVIKPRHSEEDLGLIPDYVEALVSMSSGNYQSALSILDSLSNSGLVDIKGKMRLMETVNDCYKKIGNFEKVAERLEDKLFKAESNEEKGSLLWELANVRGNCLGDYQSAEMALVEFLMLEPNAIWAHEAYSKLAETQYYLKKYESAAATYKKHIKTFPDDPNIARSMFDLGCVLSQDLGNYKQAAAWYSQLLNSFKSSKYRPAALFNRAECYLSIGKVKEALNDYKAYLAIAPDGLWRSACLEKLRKNKQL